MLLDAKINLAFLSEIEGAPVDFHNLLVDEIGLIVNSFHPLAVQQSVSTEGTGQREFHYPNADLRNIQKLRQPHATKMGLTPRSYTIATRSTQTSAWCRPIWALVYCHIRRRCVTPMR